MFLLAILKSTKSYIDTFIICDEFKDIGLVIHAYWDLGTCGPEGEDYNFNWCDGHLGNCPSIKSTSLCQTGMARLTKFEKPFSLDGCEYRWYAEYTCIGSVGKL